MFTTTMNKGLHITFENGITASVQWGPGNYCDCPASLPFDFALKKASHSCKTAEVWAWGRSLEMDVIGHLSPKDVLKFLNWCESWTFNSKPFSLT